MSMKPELLQQNELNAIRNTWKRTPVEGDLLKLLNHIEAQEHWIKDYGNELEFYGEISDYMKIRVNLGLASEVYRDKGERARAVIKKWTKP